RRAGCLGRAGRAPVNLRDSANRRRLTTLDRNLHYGCSNFIAGEARRMRLKELRGLPVIDPTAARKIGIVSDYQVDPATGRLAALDIDAVKNGGTERIMAQRIRRVGGSAVILTA